MQGRRLRQARELAGYSSAKEAAEALGVPVPTYLQHENGARGITAAKAQFYANHLNVTAEWILYGRSDLDQDRQDALLALYEQLSEHHQREALAFIRGLVVGSARPQAE